MYAKRTHADADADDANNDEITKSSELQNTPYNVCLIDNRGFELLTKEFHNIEFLIALKEILMK